MQIYTMLDTLKAIEAQVIKDKAQREATNTQLDLLRKNMEILSSNYEKLRQENQELTTERDELKQQMPSHPQALD